MSDTRLACERFPRASAYHPDWQIGSLSGGANSLWLAEWLSEAMDLRPGMRVLDLGCGRAASSVFLHREFGVQVWAVDLWCSPSENRQRICDAGVDDAVFPLHANARALPFAADFFDAIVSIDSYFYYGTDDHYLNDVARFVKPGGQIGIAGAAMLYEVQDVPEWLRAWWSQDEPWCLHSADWWRWHWNKTGIVTVETADALADGWRYWLAWQRVIAPDNDVELTAIETDAGRTMGYARCIGRRIPDAVLQEPVASIAVPPQYTQHPLLRSETA